MITRDYLLRQLQQAMRVLAQVLFHKNAREYEQAQDVLARGLQELTGLDIEQLRQMNPETLLSICRMDDTLSPEKAIALADLLREDESREGRERALWLYEAIAAAGQLVPFDIHDRIAALHASLHA